MSHAHWHTWLLLVHPPRVQRRLDLLGTRLGFSVNLWQIELGVLRMWHRMLFRSETIGISTTHGVRKGSWARLLQWRAFRFFCLVREGSFVFWDSSGLFSGPDTIVRHLLANHHDGERFLYDLELLELLYPEHLAVLERSLAEVLDGREPRGEWWRDLCVYEHYHEDLAAGLAAFRSGSELRERYREDADTSFLAYLRWCARQPGSPAETWALFRAGAYSLHLGRLQDAGAQALAQDG